MPAPTRPPPLLPSLVTPQDLKFGTVFTDHMFLAEHEAERGWGAPAVRPLGLLPLHPASQVLHYGERRAGLPPLAAW